MQSTTKYLYTIILLLLFPYLSKAQQITFYHLSLPMANNYVRDIYQNDIGYIWLATTNGLFRYDSYSILPIEPQGKEQKALMPDNHIEVMRPYGRSNSIWLRLRGNIYSLFNTHTESFSNYSDKQLPLRYFSKPNDLPDGRKRVIDNRGNEVIFDNNGTNVWYNIHGRQYHFGNIYSAELTRRNFSGRFFFVCGGDGTIWVSTYGNGLFAYNTHDGSMHHYLSSDKDSPIRTDYLVALYEDKSGNIWVSEEDYGLTCITRNNLPGQYYYFTNSDDHTHFNVIRLLKNIGGKVYVGNRGEAFSLFNPVLQSLTTIGNYDDDIIDVETDRDGTLWLATRQSGIYVGNRHYEHSSDGFSLSEGKISDIMFDSKGRAWISFFKGGVDLAERKSDGSYSFRHFFTGKHAIRQPRQMLTDHKGNIWLCSNEGVYMFKPDALIRNASAYKHYALTNDETQSNECHCIYEDSRHEILVGTSGYGIIVIDNAGSGRVVKRITTDEGLPDNNIESIAEDKFGTVWIGTDHGLSSYSAKDKIIRSHFTSPDELANIFTEGTATLLPNGDMAMGTKHGFLVFNPEKMTPAKPVFNLVVSDLYINGFPVRQVLSSDDMPDGIALTKELILNHNQNSLTFYFSDFNFGNANSTMYTYKLDGYDEDWSPLTAENSAQYKDLPFGTYTLHVKARSSSGEWNPHEVKLTIKIRPPFWLTWWAIAVYIIIICVALWYVYHNAKEKLMLRQRVEIERKLTDYKLVFFTNISHEFRTPLTLIEGAMEHIDSIGNIPGPLRQPLSNMRRSVERMLRLINQLLEFRKMQNNKLHLALEETDVIEFLRNIFYMFADTADNKNIAYTFLPFENHHMMYIDKSFLDKIAYNIISNAFKYTPSGHSITVRVRQKDAKTMIIVEDTGIGIPSEKRKELFTRFVQSSYSHDSMGIGLHLSAALAEAHHGSISYEPNPDGGSIFTVSIPDSKDVYNPDDFLVKDNAVLRDENKHDEEATQKRNQVDYKELEASPMNDRRVLIVEDDNDVAEMLNSELGAYFQTSIANNGQEALEKLRADGANYDLIISDVRMPVMNGIELTKAVRADKDIADIPIILLTALTAEEKHVRGLNAGADAYIEKPFSIPLLVAKAKQLIEQRQKLKVSYAKEVIGKRETPKVITDELDAKFKEQFDTWLSAHIEDPNLNIDDFARSMNYGRSTFYRKVKGLLGTTPNDYVKQLRMQTALELLKDDTLTIAEVAYKVGISDAHYFSKMFKASFGISPTQFRRGKKKL